MRLYVNNFPYRTTAEDLMQLFDDWAPQSAFVSICADGRPAGYGFVEVDEVAVQSAIDTLDGSEYHGRRLCVSVARRQPRKRFNERERAVSRAAAARETR